ncbi:unnamed protein product [Paramecium sonneborni]|uniref:Uncharacterized protein n=1 Tax=Paramecium sonneborni TaxID=65129 RepID=A0A8S1R2D8_9CILI|nr:unnamed protein product [Paramecium sonneborni]
MNQFSNYLFQYQTKKVFSIYQHQCNSKSPQIKRQFDSKHQSNSNNQKYLRQFKCQDLFLNQQQTILNSPKNKQNLIATKTKGKGKENNNQQNANIIYEPQKIPIEAKSPQNFRQNPYNVKQPTPEFENRYQNDESEQILRLSNSELNFRFVHSQQESEKQELKNEQLETKINNISSEQSVNNFSKNDEILVQIDSVRKSRITNQTKTIAIQAFESQEFDKPEDQLNKIFGSLKKVKIIKKKFSQTQGTQRTMEDDSFINTDTNKQIKTVGGLSNIDIKNMQLRTEFTDLDSQRSKSTYQDENDRYFSSFRNNVVTPKKMQQNKMSFLMYKKKQERKQ